MDLLNFPGLSGWPALVASIVAVVAYGIYINRSAKNKAEKVATEAYEKAITAMQTHTGILEKRIEEAEEENARLEKRVKEGEEENARLKSVVETIYTALESWGIYITVQGKMIHIKERGKGQRTIHIKDEAP